MLGFVRKYRARPGLFVREVLGAEPQPWQEDALDRVCVKRVRRLSIRSGHGTGKIQCNQTLTPTTQGNRLWSDIEPGDEVFGSDGAPTLVTAKYPHHNWPFYKVTFDDGSFAMAGPEHLWNVRGRQERRKKVSGWRTMSTEDIMEAGVKRKNGASMARQWEIPAQGPAQFEEREVDIHPYLLGVWIGDGTRQLPEFCKPHEEVVDKVRSFGYEVSTKANGTQRRALNVSHLFRAEPLIEKGSHERYIPDDYKFNTVANRMALFEGLCDTDGEVQKSGAIGYGTTSKQLAEDVVWLARSLGCKAMLQPAVKRPFYTHNGERMQGRDFYRVTINAPFNPFTIKHRREAFKPSEHRYTVRWIDSIEFSHYGEGHCISVAAEDNLYLTKDFIVTHNTTTMAWAMLHTLTFSGSSKVICTAPAAGTLFDGLMAELKMWITKLPEALQELFEVTNDHIRVKAMPTEAFVSARTSSSDKPEALAGIHAARVLLVVDEASGVPEDVFKAARGSMSTSNATTVLIGNPTRNSGYFFDTHHVLKDWWECMHISCIGNPNVDPDFIEEVRTHYGEDSTEFRIRVLGEFPKDDGSSFIARESVMAAMEREFEVPDETPEVWGLDVARGGGDRVALCRRRGVVVPEINAWRGKDLMGTVGVVKALWDQTKSSDRPVEILVDAIGMGAGVADRLIELGLPAVAVNVSEGVGMMGQGVRMRDELWFRGKMMLTENGVSLPYDEELASELCTPTAEYMSNGRLKVEGKREMKRRGYQSPDKADAFLLTLYTNASPYETVTTKPVSNAYNRRGSLTRNLNAVV